MCTEDRQYRWGEMIKLRPSAESKLTGEKVLLVGDFNPPRLTRRREGLLGQISREVLDHFHEGSIAHKFTNLPGAEVNTLRFELGGHEIRV